MKLVLGKQGDPAKFKSGGEHLYHVTTADRLPAIAESGLVPGLPSRWEGEYAQWSAGKVFFTMDLWVAGRFVAEELDRDFHRGGEIQVPVLLRIHKKHLRGAREDMLWFNVYVERTISPDKLEAWVPWKQEWIPLADAVQGFKGLSFGRVTDSVEFEKLKQDFFEKDWVRR